MSKLPSFPKVHPVALAQCEHVHQILPLNLISLPYIHQNVVGGCLFELLLGQIWHSMLVF